MGTKLDGQFTPGGRLVMGHLTNLVDKDHKGKAIPEAERNTLFFGLAVPKVVMDPERPDVNLTQECINALWQMAATDYAQVPLVMAEINQGLKAKNFAWKIQDGDAPQFDKKTGAPKATPEHYKGCWIFKFSTTLVDIVDACDENGNPLNRANVKIGDYADILYNSQVNGKIDDTAGIYLNPIAIRRLRVGDAITSGISASAAFAGRAAVAPAGAPLMPTGAGATPPATGGGMPTGNAPATGSAPAPTPETAGAGVTSSPTEPHTDILTPAATGGMPGM